MVEGISTVRVVEEVVIALSKSTMNPIADTITALYKFKMP